MSTSNKSPLFILAAVPTTRVKIPNFFSESNPYATLLKDPPYLRYMGWNMLTLDRPRIINGQAWEVRNGDRKTFRFYRDGSLVAIVYSDNTFLGWGQSDVDFHNNPRLNPLAVIEYVYEFVELYRNMLNNFDDVKEIRFELSIKNSKVGDKYLYIIPRKLDDPFPLVHGGPGTLKKDFEASVVAEAEADNINSSKFVAFEVLAELFGRFGVPSDKIPYTSVDKDNRRFVDIDSFPKN